MLNRFYTAFGIAFFGALALYWAFPKSEAVGLAFLTMVVFGAPFVIMHFGRTLYTAVRMGYVIPDEAEGPAYRSDKPVTFWSNVILSLVFIPVMIAGAVVVAQEAVRLATNLL